MIAPLDQRDGKMQDAARLAAERDRKFREDREPTIATRLAQIGVLGWAIVAPILLGVVIGRWLDWAFEDRDLLHCAADHAWRGGRHVDGVAMDAPAMTVALLIGALRPRRGARGRAFPVAVGSVALLREGRVGFGVALQGLRFALLAIALVLIARQGGNFFLAAATGVLLVRVILTRHYRRLA